MTQEELRTKLNDYDIEGATLKQLIADRDFARDMYSIYARMGRAMNNVMDSLVYEGRKIDPTRELDDAMTELSRAIGLEQARYYNHAETLGCEIDERLSKIDNN